MASTAVGGTLEEDFEGGDLTWRLPPASPTTRLL